MSYTASRNIHVRAEEHIKQELLSIAYEDKTTLSQVALESFRDYIEKRRGKKNSAQRPLNFLSKYVGIDDSSEEEFQNLLKYTQESRKEDDNRELCF